VPGAIGSVPDGMALAVLVGVTPVYAVPWLWQVETDVEHAVSAHLGDTWESGSDGLTQTK
jgi:hypothetical protein